MWHLHPPHIFLHQHDAFLWLARQDPLTMEQSVADAAIQTPPTAADDSESWMTIASDTPNEQVGAPEISPPPSPSPSTATTDESELLHEGESAGSAIETKGSQPTKAVQALTPTNKQPRRCIECLEQLHAQTQTNLLHGFSKA